jgi:hypothetical protein
MEHNKLAKALFALEEDYTVLVMDRAMMLCLAEDYLPPVTPLKLVQ